MSTDPHHDAPPSYADAIVSDSHHLTAGRHSVSSSVAPPYAPAPYAHDHINVGLNNLHLNSTSSSSSSSSSSAPLFPSVPNGYHLVYLESSPLVKNANNKEKLDTLDIEGETALLIKALTDSRKNINLYRTIATVDNLLSCIVKGCRALHFSGHGFTDSLAFEGEDGSMHQMDQNSLQKVISIALPHSHTEAHTTNHHSQKTNSHTVKDEDTAENNKKETTADASTKHDDSTHEGDESKPVKKAAAMPDSYSTDYKDETTETDTGIQLAFVSACMSQRSGEALVKAGIPHVIAVDANQRVLDQAAKCFLQHFYQSIFSGRTVRKAFQTAQVAVQSNPSITNTDEAKKFLLLPLNGDHDKVIFNKLPDGTLHDYSPPLPYAAVPALPDKFAYRNVEIQAVIAQFHARWRLVSITGEGGIGKTAIATAFARYVLKRRKYEGLFWIDLKQLDPPNGPSRTIFDLCRSVCNYPNDKLSNADDPLAFLKWIGDKKCLFVFDDIDKCRASFSKHDKRDLRSFISSLCQACPSVHILCTGTELLGSDNKLVANSKVVEREVAVKALKPMESVQLWGALLPRPFNPAEVGVAHMSQVREALVATPLMKLIGGIPERIVIAANLGRSLNANDILPELEKHIRKPVNTQLLELFNHDQIAYEFWAGFDMGLQEVPSVEFANRFNTQLFFKLTDQTSRPLDMNDLQVIESKLRTEGCRDGYISPQSFARFYVTIFKPICSVIRLILPYWLETFPHKLIYGLVNRQQSAEMLSNCEVGTFLIRLSETQPGKMAVAYVVFDDRSKQKIVSHTLINPTVDDRFSIQLAEGESVFSSLGELVLQGCRPLTHIYPHVDKTAAFKAARNKDPRWIQL